MQVFTGVEGTIRLAPSIDRHVQWRLNIRAT